MKRIPILSLSVFLVSLSIAASLALAPSKVLAASNTFTSVPSGYAYANYISIPTVTGSTNYGPNVPVALNCIATTANTLTNSALHAPLGSFGTSDTARSTITLSRSGTDETIQTDSQIQNLSLLGGLIRANEIHAMVASTATTTGDTSTNSSTFSGLRIAGSAVASNVAPNTTINIPLLGYVVLNEQSGPFNGATSTSISVNMIDIHITATNSLGLVVGTRIIIAHADSATQTSAVIATAYGLYGSGLSQAIGPVAIAGISCKGGSSTSNAGTFTSSTVGTTGSESSSASGQITASGTMATAQNTISNANLLSSLITTGQITTSASVAVQSTGSRAGSASFQNTVINGTVLPTNPAPNTRQNLSGIGYVVINEQYGSNDASSATESVIGLDIYITQTNILGLPIGARIVVSRVYASASRY